MSKRTFHIFLKMCTNIKKYEPLAWLVQASYKKMDHTHNTNFLFLLSPSLSTICVIRKKHF